MSEPPPPPPSDLPAGLFGPRVRTDAAPSSSAPSSESMDSYSLYKYIDLRGVYGVNVGPPRADLAEAARKALKPWHRRADLSDCTESLDGPNLIVNIPFSQAVKISSLLINQGSGEDASRVSAAESSSYRQSS
ncbi:hypothetical protein BDZ90DRAFT_229841 [Jaminaea rosea]|uniref:PITH domain-containing protein n=1 Tax=Jaminaea rosea TaxID=1569628 RepID=A0A316V1G1_9BASI|nr:hypothetical protein BDZ90DRAFT_229841 [Jaminaea rosea]PWN30848.1 hypothetical protein BDZ90DRAFT_229841 [Jaminaea rosea]